MPCDVRKWCQAGVRRCTPSNAPARPLWQRFSLPTELAPYGGDADSGSGSDPSARSASYADSFSCAPPARRSWPAGFDSFPARVFSVRSSLMLLARSIGAARSSGTVKPLFESLARVAPNPLHSACPRNRRHLRIQLTPRKLCPLVEEVERVALRDRASNRPCPYGERPESVRAGTKRGLTDRGASIKPGPGADPVPSADRGLSRQQGPGCMCAAIPGTSGASGPVRGLATAGADSGFVCEGNGWHQQASRSRDSASLVSGRAELIHIDAFPVGHWFHSKSLRSSEHAHKSTLRRGKARGGVSRFGAFVSSQAFRHTKCRQPAMELRFGARSVRGTRSSVFGPDCPVAMDRCRGA